MTWIKIKIIYDNYFNLNIGINKIYIRDNYQIHENIGINIIIIFMMILSIFLIIIIFMYTNYIQIIIFIITMKLIQIW